jgi:hypothetical protein
VSGVVSKFRIVAMFATANVSKSVLFKIRMDVYHLSTRKVEHVQVYQNTATKQKISQLLIYILKKGKDMAVEAIVL